jgi:hypothetical protein
MDCLLAGTPIVDMQPTLENSRLFAEFSPDDMRRAAALAVLCEKVADEQPGITGIQAAIDKMYEFLPKCPLGMVEYAAKLFLTHYAPVRDLLRMRSLEERQPGMVEPSDRFRIISYQNFVEPEAEQQSSAEYKSQRESS